eukprot:Em0003g864a
MYSPPENLTATLIYNSLIQLSWIPSNGRQIGSFLDYIVLVMDGSGFVVHNETGTVSVASIGGTQIPGGRSYNQVDISTDWPTDNVTVTISISPMEVGDQKLNVVSPDLQED